MEDSLVFVYGTLRRGGVRAMERLFPATFIGVAMVEGTLYDLGSYPGLRLEARGSLVSGEVYRVTADMLERLDQIEGVREGYYVRCEVAVELPDGSRTVCWVYEANPQVLPCNQPIASGDWIAHVAAKETTPPDDWPFHKAE